MKRVNLWLLGCAGLAIWLYSCNNTVEFHTNEVDENIALEKTVLAISVVADSLEVPWDIQYDKHTHSLFFTEIKGVISRLDLKSGEINRLHNIEEVHHRRTSGLLGMALHPDFKNNPYLFVSYTVRREGVVSSKLVRFIYRDDSLSNPELLLEIPGSRGHNGARLAFSKDGKLLWATGDAQGDTFSQDSTSLNGKILRLNTDGSVPENNPIEGSYVYAWGFRNMQGLTVSDKGDIYTSEHGEAIEDEVNKIEPLRNYGWPNMEGKHDLPDELAYAQLKNTKEPLISWTPVIAPAGIAYYNSSKIPEWKNSLLLTTLKSQGLRILKLDDDRETIVSEEVFLEGHYGRLRTVIVSPEGDIYVTTSNQDWNPQPGFPKGNDDKILRISYTDSAKKTPLRAKQKINDVALQSDESLYKAYCGSCHKADGSGVEGLFPSLKGSAMVNGSSDTLIGVFLNGIKNNEKAEQMPSFSFLTDEEGAAILNYVRKAWGNSASEISAAEVRKQRTN